MCAPVAVTTSNVVTAASSGIQALLVSQILALSTVVGVLVFRALSAAKRTGLKLKLGLVKRL